MIVKHFFRSFWIILLLLFVHASTSEAQNELSFTAFTDTENVVQGYPFQITFLLKNARGSSFVPPSFNGFDVVSGPAQSVSTSIVNGEMSSEMSISYTLVAQAKGSFTIGKASIKVGRKNIQSNEIRLVVKEADERSLPGDTGEKPIFLLAELSDSIARVGQQILLDYRIFTTREVDSYHLMSESDYSGLYAQEVRRFNDRVERVVIDGTQYSTKILKRIALFPQQGGSFTIDPMILQLGVVSDNGNRQRGFFFLRDVENVTVSSQKQDILVKSLPENPPASFCGGVGNFDVEYSTGNKNLKTDDAFSLKIKISGNGDMKRLSAPYFEFPAQLELYDPKVIDENLFEQSGEIISKKTFEYLFVPQEKGKFSFIPEFSFFDTDSMKYRTIKGSRIDLSVSMGKGSKQATSLSDDAISGGQDIRFIHLDTSFKRINSKFWEKGWFWVLTLIPLLFLSIAYVYRNRLDRFSKMDQKLLRKNKAEKVARKKLKLARKFLDENREKDFYEEISKSAYGFVCDKFGIDISDLSKERVQEIFEKNLVKQSTRDTFSEIIRHCEMALFAGRQSESKADLYNLTIGFISEMEKQF